MIKVIRKLIDDTLKTPKGKWSRTSLTMFTCLYAALSYLFYELQVHGKFYIEAFYGLLGVATGMKWIDVVDKHKSKQTDEN
jgi:hypothetical protein